MFNFFDHDNGFTKSGLPSLTKQSMGLELYLCGTTSHGTSGNGQSGGGGGVPSSGATSLSNIQNVWGGSNPISLSEYYSVDTGVPTSGTISVSDLQGTSSFPTTHLSLLIDPGNTACYSGSGTTVNDLSNTQTSALTLSNSVTYNSSNGGHFSFAGSSAGGNGTYIQMNSKVNIDRVVKDYTWHVFINQYQPILGFPPNQFTLIGCGQDPSGVPAANIAVNSSGRFIISTTNGSGGSFGTATGNQSQTTSTSILSTGSWKHVAISTEMYGNCGFARTNFYLNGSLVETEYLNQQSNSPFNEVYTLFGSPNVSSSLALDGAVGVVAYYSNEQSATEVQQVYDAFKGRYGLT